MDSSMTDQKKRATALARLTDIVGHLDVNDEPFLYYLPQLLADPRFSRINPDHAVRFAEQAVRHDRPPIVADAVNILNRTVDRETGHLIPFFRDMYFDNHSFFWSELGDRIKTEDVIMHVFNKTIFALSLSP
jgi:hypothetical protein